MGLLLLHVFSQGFLENKARVKAYTLTHLSIIVWCNSKRAKKAGELFKKLDSVSKAGTAGYLVWQDALQSYHADYRAWRSISGERG